MKIIKMIFMLLITYDVLFVPTYLPPMSVMLSCFCVITFTLEYPVM